MAFPPGTIVISNFNWLLLISLNIQIKIKKLLTILLKSAFKASHAFRFRSSYKPSTIAITLRDLSNRQ